MNLQNNASFCLKLTKWSSGIKWSWCYFVSVLAGRVSPCGFESASAPALRVGTLIFVSHLDFAEGGILAEDAGTQSPAGEGDEAQLGIIKPSTVSMKGAGKPGWLGVPQTEQLVQRLHTQQSLSLYSLVRKKKKERKAQIWQWLSGRIPITEPRHNLTSLLLP